MVTIYVHINGKIISLSRFSLAIQTLAADVPLGKEKKSFILISSFVIMAVNCCKIHDFPYSNEL